MKYFCYKIHYSYGVHHMWLETNEQSFYDVIDQISTEFEIYKDEGENITLYYIINYCDDIDIIGSVQLIDNRRVL